MDEIKEQDIAVDALEGLADNWPIAEIDIAPHQCNHPWNLVVFEEVVEFSDYKVVVSRCVGCGETIADYIPAEKEKINKPELIHRNICPPRRR